MPAIQYRIWHWGNLIQPADGISDQYHVAIQTRAKKGEEGTSIYTVPNEWVCCQLGTMLGLPIPGGAVVERNGEFYYASLDFNISGHRLPPADTKRLAREMPEMACGILAFDAWIANCDRSDKNLSFVPSNRAVHLYDHGHAFLHRDGRKSLSKVKNKLWNGDHCLAEKVNTLVFLDQWLGKISQIPEFFIAQTIQDASEIGLPKEDVRFCQEFLLDRRERLEAIFRDSRAIFPNAKSLYEQIKPEDVVDYQI